MYRRQLAERCGSRVRSEGCEMATDDLLGFLWATSDLGLLQWRARQNPHSICGLQVALLLTSFQLEGLLLLACLTSK